MLAEGQIKAKKKNHISVKAEKVHGRKEALEKEARKIRQNGSIVFPLLLPTPTLIPRNTVAEPT